MISSSESLLSELPVDSFSGKANRSFQRSIALGITILLNFLLLMVFFDATWAPADDGIYAHLAERILSGEISNKDFQSIHLGLINFVNAASLWFFGPQLVSLRYPLIFIGLVQAIIVHILFSCRSAASGIIASVSLTGLGMVQYFNPTAHWYCHALFVGLIGVMHWTTPSYRGRIIVLGYLIGTIFFFRQLTGVIGGIGLLTFLLIETKAVGAVSGQDRIFSRFLLGIMGVGLSGYFLSHASVSDFLLFGLCPILMIGFVFFSTTCHNRETFRIVWQLGVGVFLSLLPILAYHLMNDSMTPWLSDTFVRAINLSQLTVFSQREYGEILSFSLYTLTNSSGVHSLINGTYLLLLSILSLLNGGLLLWTFLRERREGNQVYIPSALPLLAMFYAVVSIIYPVIIYLYLSVGLSLLGVLWQLYDSNRLKPFGVILSVFLSLVAIPVHAGQPLGRSWSKFMQGEKVSLVPVPELKKLGLSIEAEDGDIYSELVRVIQQNTHPEEPIFVFPNSPEIYFLADRRNPYYFYYLPLGLTNKVEGQIFIQSLKEAPPALAVFNSRDINNTEVSMLIADHIQENFYRIQTVGNFEIFSPFKF